MEIGDFNTIINRLFKYDISFYDDRKKNTVGVFQFQVERQETNLKLFSILKIFTPSFSEETKIIAEPDTFRPLQRHSIAVHNGIKRYIDINYGQRTIKILIDQPGLSMEKHQIPIPVGVFYDNSQIFPLLSLIKNRARKESFYTVDIASGACFHTNVIFLDDQELVIGEKQINCQVIELSLKEIPEFKQRFYTAREPIPMVAKNSTEKHVIEISAFNLIPKLS